MLIHDLVHTYLSERSYNPENVNDLLDYYQSKYIYGEINFKDYRNIFAYLHKQGAVSAFEDHREKSPV